MVGGYTHSAFLTQDSLQGPPNPQKITHYMVTGEFFQKDVISQLNDPLLDGPGKVIVLSHLRVFGNLPHSTGPDKIHYSLGEALDTFAKIEFRGKLGPQASELARMRTADQVHFEVLGRAHGTERALVEKRFGPGKPSDPKKLDSPSIYSLRTGKLEVHWTSDGKAVDYIYGLHGKKYPTAGANEPEKLAKQARERADADRTLILEVLSKMRDSLKPEERTWIRALLDRSNSHLHWTANEIRLILGE